MLFDRSLVVDFALLVALVCSATEALSQPVTPAAVPAVAEVVARDLSEEVVRINVTVKDLYNRSETQPVAVTIFRPQGDGPFPLMIFNHGRAVTEKRALQTRWRPEYVARYFVAKGFVVMAPTRIGYWETYGDFDPESSGPCNSMRIEPMLIAASDQVLATLAYAKTLPYVDGSRWMVGGQSVGGVTTVATVGRNPPGLLAGINFAVGTGGNPDTNPGRPCSPQQISNYWGSIAKSATAPMLWLYWKNDKFWGEETPKRWHKAWLDGGGRAEFASFAPIGDDGHSGWGADMDSWLPVVDAFLAQLGFTANAIVRKPPATAFAAVTQTNKVPISDAAKTNGYAKFLEAKSPRAFAIGNKGGWGYATRDYAVGKALGNCSRSGQTCKLYAVDDDVVWQPE